ncbi:MAG: DUF2177 family protein [Candidatus Saccharimonadales bacterium]
MGQFLIKLLVAGGIMGIIDAVWLSIVANKFYKAQLGPLLLEKPNMIAAVLFYVIYVIGIVVFAVMPAVATGDWKVALGLGALLGLVAYATYDLTNLATLKGFPVKIVIVDLLWGTALTALVATLTYLVVSR